jgi:hypothetical protein
MKLRSPLSRNINISGLKFQERTTPKTLIDAEAPSCGSGLPRKKMFPGSSSSQQPIGISSSTSKREMTSASLLTGFFKKESNRVVQKKSSASLAQTVTSEYSSPDFAIGDIVNPNSRKGKKDRLKSFGQKQYLKASKTFVAFERTTEERCSNVATKAVEKSHWLACKLRYKQRTMLTTTTDDTVEISLQSHPRRNHLATCKRVAVKQYSKAAEKVSSLVHRQQDVSPQEPVSDCQICFGPMSESDLKHPLQCATPQCHFNFCASCIQSLIKSSEDAYMVGSDGSRQVKVFLQCPTCRCDLSKSIRRTLLLRTADMTLSPSVRSSLLLHMLDGHHPDSHPVNKEKSMKMDTIETEICRARLEEREFFKTKPRSQEPQEPATSQNDKSPTRSKHYKHFQGIRERYARYNRALNPIENLSSTIRRRSIETPRLNNEQTIRRSGVKSIRSPYPIVHHPSFQSDRASCFFIDTHMNFAGLNPRLRFQL